MIALWLALVVAAPAARPPTDITGVVVTPGPRTAPPADATYNMTGEDDLPGTGQGVSIWPADAYQVRRSGEVTLSCWVNLEGLAEWCRVAYERPAGKGFGAAAKAMRPHIKVEPRKGPDGKPVAGLMNIALTYKSPDIVLPGEATGFGTIAHQPLPNTRITLMNDPVWTKTASFEAVERAYPATGGGVEGFAVAHCRVRGDGRLSGCRVATGDPHRQGFGAAAVKLAADFRVDPRTLPASTRGEPLEVDVPIRFAPPGAERTVGAAAWLQGFDTQATPKLFPPEAAAKGLTSGRGVARCVVGERGGLTACAPDGGDPEGFSDVAAKVAGAMRMNLWSADARPVEGATVYVGVRLNLKGGS
jgi:TonB family protein